LERDAIAAASLRTSQERLKVDGMRIIQTDALAWLAANVEERFDGVFLDPPFASALWPQLWPLLLPVLADGAWVYVETAINSEIELPPGLHPEKIGKSRHSKYLLAQWHKPSIG
jgi:16S rRNA (guanine966-N2)-methyltransferase